MSATRMDDFTGFFDDAAVFPPGSAELGDAVRAHLRRRGTGLQPLVGPLLLTPDRLPAAAAAAAQTAEELGIDLTTEPLRAALVVAPDAAPQALAAVAGTPSHVVLGGLELKTAGRWREQLAAGVELARDAPYPVHVELAADAVDAGGIGALAGTRARLKYRTGGLDAALFPSDSRLAHVISAAARAGVAFKLTAGLHRAVRHIGPTTGFAHHGFLNIALTTAAARSGAGVEQVRELLAEPDPGVVRARYEETTGSWRALFESFGTCSIDEPVESLAHLGLLDDTLLRTPNRGPA